MMLYNENSGGIYPTTKRLDLTGSPYNSTVRKDEKPKYGIEHITTTRMFGGEGMEYIDHETGKRVVSCIPLHGKGYTPVGIEHKIPWKIE